MVPLDITYPVRSKVVVTKSRFRNAVRTLSAVFFLTAWYSALIYFFLRSPEHYGSIHAPRFWIWVLFMAAPIAFIGRIKNAAMAAFTEVSFVFDRSANAVYQGNKTLASFGEIESVQIHEFVDDSDSELNSYRLCLKLVDGREIELETASNRMNLCGIAKILAKHLDKEYVVL